MNLQSATVMQQAQARCADIGARFTVKRQQVFDCLLNCGRAVSAYEIVDLYDKTYEDRISAMSVYRILDFLQEIKLVHKLTLANKYIVCAHANCSEDHEIIQFLICEKCFRVNELDIDPGLYHQLDKNARNSGFEPQNSVLEMSCICNHCK